MAEDTAAAAKRAALNDISNKAPMSGGYEKVRARTTLVAELMLMTGTHTL